MEGRAIPGIIKNGTHFYVSLMVYEDARVGCWNFEDFEHFKKDVHRGWVAISVPNGKALSIHGVGQWIINKGEWEHNTDSFIKMVKDLILEMNPNWENVYKHVPKKWKGIGVGESGTGCVFTKKEENPFENRISGEATTVFYQSESGEYYVARLEMYSKESLFIHHIPEPFELNLDKLKELIADKRVVTDPPIGSKVCLLDLGSCEIIKMDYCTKTDQKLLEIEGVLRELAGEESLISICKTAYDNYLKDPCLKTKAELKVAYENIPEHERMYVGDMDTKDVAVRMVIYGDHEMKNWSHYMVAEKLGDKLPSITVPKPRDAEDEEDGDSPEK